MGLDPFAVTDLLDMGVVQDDMNLVLDAMNRGGTAGYVNPLKIHRA